MENRNARLLIAIPIIFLFVFNLLTWSILRTFSATFWSGYLFTTFSIGLFTFIVARFVLKRATTLTDIFFGFPLLYISWVYLLLQLLVGSSLMMLPQVNLLFSIVIQILLFAGYLVLAISAIFGKRVVQQIDRETNEKILYIRSLTADVEGMISRVSDPSMKKKLNELKEGIQYSDPMSHPSLSVLENKIAAKINELKEIIPTEATEKKAAIVQEVLALLVERNSKCKLLK